MKVSRRSILISATALAASAALPGSVSAAQPVQADVFEFDNDPTRIGLVFRNWHGHPLADLIDRAKRKLSIGPEFHPTGEVRETIGQWECALAVDCPLACDGSCTGSGWTPEMVRKMDECWWDNDLSTDERRTWSEDGGAPALIVTLWNGEAAA